MELQGHRYDVAIAGAGPAGLATALNLLREHPEMAGRIVAFDKARHPRFKVCAGGLIPRTLAALRELGLTPLPIAAIEVFSGTASTEAGDVALGESPEPLCTIVRRNGFDAYLAAAARDAGLVLLEDTRVRAVEQRADEVRIATDRGEFSAAVLVGADGSGSVVRRMAFGPGKENIGRAIMTDVAVDALCAPEFVQRQYRFDFNCVAAGVRGYSWSFPCLIDGAPHLNIGIYDQMPREAVSPAGAKRDLMDELRRAFPLAVCSDTARKAFPIRWYDPRDRYAAGRVILAGDAAGVDPLMGEGISCAFEHGKLAAAAVADFVGGDRGALEAYSAAIHRGIIGRKLRRLGFAARRFYGPRHRLYFRVAAMSARARELGVDWYNGARRV
ncbi:MAG TPA: FAD-dependent monooxygenase, partial [Candidatus Binataceae bacterium]|nr:FAD-dependent monooxygenase [Candidatus Binataceae bacterium]